jgi:prepilin-type N-terminal cleavage/methylation domain-containing protein
MYRTLRNESFPLTRRSAFSLLEVIVAAAILAVILTVAARMLNALGNQQQASQRRALALQTVQALAEQLGNLPWDELTPEAANRTNVPAVSQTHLPGAKLSIAVHEEQEPLSAKRVTVALTWNGPNGQPSGPVRLTTWVFHDATPPSS